MCQEENNTHCWYFHHEYTYEQDPPDLGAVNQIMFWFGFYLDEWLWGYGNMDLWIYGIWDYSLLPIGKS